LNLYVLKQRLSQGRGIKGVALGPHLNENELPSKCKTENETVAFSVDTSNKTGLSELMEEFIEIDENLVRSELDYMERGEHLKRRKEIYEELYPETKRGGDYGNQYVPKPRLNATVAFSQDTSNKTGMSERTIQEDVQIATVLDDEERKIVKRVDILRITSRSKLRSVPLMKYSMLLGILVLVSIAGAELDTVTMGPYEVSFDMGDIEYEILDYTAKEGETYGGVEFASHSIPIAIDNNIIWVVIFDYDRLGVTTFDVLYDALPYNPHTYIRTIDNKTVVLFVNVNAVGDEIKFHATYSLEYDEWYDPDGEFTADRYANSDAYLIGNNNVEIISSADWDTTRQFLNTVHVERISE